MKIKTKEADVPARMARGQAHAGPRLVLERLNYRASFSLDSPVCSQAMEVL